MVMMVMVVVVWVWETFCLRLRPSLKSRSQSQAATLKSLKAHLTILQIRTADATDAGDTKLRPFFVKQKVKDKLKMFLSFGLSIKSLYFRVMTTYDDSIMSEKAKYKDKFLFITVLK